MNRNSLAFVLIGLPDLRVGSPRALQARMAYVKWVGEPAKDEEYKKLGVTPPRANMGSINEGVVLEMNDPEVRDADFPAAGLMTTAGDIALFYQALLNDGRAHDGTRIWQSAMLREARRIRSGNLIDPARSMTANRALGIVVAGGDGKANLRGFGRTNSAEAFGHPGFGGQIGWAGPATGISFGYLTNGFDRNDLRGGRRSVAVCSLAGGPARSRCERGSRCRQGLPVARLWRTSRIFSSPAFMRSERLLQHHGEAHRGGAGGLKSAPPA